MMRDDKNWAALLKFIIQKLPPKFLKLMNGRQKIEFRNSVFFKEFQVTGSLSIRNENEPLISSVRSNN